MGAVPIPDTWREGSPPRTRHASRRGGRRYLTQRASPAARYRRRAFTLSTSTRATRGGVETAFRGAKLSTRSQSKRPGARPGGGRGSGGQRSAAGSARGGGGRGSLDRQPAGRPPRLAARLAPGRQVSGGAARSRAGGRAGRADGGDAHRLGVGAGGDSARPPPAAPGPQGGGSLAARRPPPGVFIQTPVAGEAVAAKTAAEPARIPGQRQRGAPPNSRLGQPARGRPQGACA